MESGPECGGGDKLTIAACYLSPEGIVLGADSTTTVNIPGNPHYFINAQKLFEIGENSTLGAVTWGLGSIGTSHRALLAKLADELARNEPNSVEEAARRWAELFWNEYSTVSTASPLAPSFAELRQLVGKAPHDPNTAPSVEMRTAEEEARFGVLRIGLTVGFCIGGHIIRDRQPAAYEVLFDPISLALPTPLQLPMNNPRFWGAPNMILRLLRGCDEGLRQSILRSGKWNGTEQDLNGLISQHTLGHAILPIRDAIDFTHACIASTIKALKFSNLSQICGGSIEIAVITADRRFRWVRHKAWDAAIADGGT
jgi:hypothetical protein